MFNQVARTCYRRRRLVVAGWATLLVALLILGNTAGGAFRTAFDLPGSESQQALDLLKQKGFASRTGEQGQVVFTSAQGVDDPAVRETMERLFTAITRNVPDTSVISPYTTAGSRQIAEGGTVAFAQINLADRSQEEYHAAAQQIKTDRNQAEVPGLRVELGGSIFAEQAAFSSEGIGLLAAVVILLVAFGSLLAMGLPITTALFGIGTGIALVEVAARFIDLPSFTGQAAAMLGIGVGIDYALFILTRYREGLHGGLAPEDAVVRAMNTAGRAVLFAGLTVVIAVLGMLAMKLSAISGLAVGIALAVLMTMLASITLLPALLGFAGRNIDRLGLPHRHRMEGAARASIWHRWSRVIQRHPWPAALAGLAVLLALAVPAISLRLGFADAGNRPTTDISRRAYDLLSQGFGPGFNGPLLLAAQTPHGQVDAAVLQQLSARLNQTPGVAFASPPQPNQAGDAAIIQVIPATSPQDVATSDLVHRLRDDIIPHTIAGSGVAVKVGGVTAGAIDFSAYTAERTPLFFGAVLALSFLLLMAVFRSLLVPLKAVVMNLLSIGAAYGVMVAVFQWGWGARLIGVGKEGPIEAWAPMTLFAIVFGLSMDYEVFLLSRIREEYDRTGDNGLAVADGLAATARVITAAAAIMVCVFGSFVLGQERALKLFGLGLAVAVLVDATVVRMVLVPATMELLGRANWWLPRRLDRILPALHVEATAVHPGAGQPPSGKPVVNRDR